ncbi:VOC family protein [Sporosarcina sp. Te-1]|uniref:VOC family protein n=1 Tax=Sporosarcina sp. Te-1 TaxID=2818390 RepID=UPI001A9F870F|nr:VOC family protein [Sporosarcina sp. Te-1]QTD43009.1 VOC family protein [Sporosarcina sp. Te-1]
MKLVFLHHPVKDLKESLAFYRDTLGLEEAWREGEHTAAFSLPGSDVRLMIDEDEAEVELGPGGMFLVDSVDNFFQENQDKLEFVKGPSDIPPGRYAIYKDNSGNYIRIMDSSKE